MSIHASRYLLYVRRPENRQVKCFCSLPGWLVAGLSAGGRILEGAQDVKITASGTTGASPFRFEVISPDSTSNEAGHNRLPNPLDIVSLMAFLAKYDGAVVWQDKHMVFGTTAVLKQTQEGILPGATFPFSKRE